MLILTDRTSNLEIDLANWDGGDALITVKVESHGYSGQNDLYILGEEFQKFCSDLMQLRKSLTGQASLKSISPNELNIVIRPEGSLGLMSVQGKCGHPIYASQNMYWHAVEFGFEFEPQQLDQAMNVTWMQKYAS